MKVTLASMCGRYYEVSLDDIHTDDGLVVIHPCWETQYETVRFVPEYIGLPGQDQITLGELKDLLVTNNIRSDLE